ncbi:Uncharacterised protein [BD1-7 clade bacterium]|uniref:Uncharacterized protein n=1 Tax=BD1-7 clade bacterium TaxID=2029982 RepID=A0A5S9NR48_9GAMM|nr:Uncharacterised protein [BD1-7 clade bacterium]CAA0092988.1 Uncharacterised protein [BD1-7 clade bacterium]
MNKCVESRKENELDSVKKVDGKFKWKQPKVYELENGKTLGKVQMGFEATPNYTYGPS